MGTMAARFYPRPASAYTFDFIYQRRPRQLNIADYNTGTVACPSTTAVTGTSTAWGTKHIGSVIRFAAAGEVNPPTGLQGLYPYAYERIITDVGSTTTLTIDEALPETLTGAKYRISDPLDIEDGASLTGLMRSMEKQMRLFRRMKSVDIQGEEAALLLAIMQAREADVRSMAMRSAGGVVNWRLRLAQMPFNPG